MQGDPQQFRRIRVLLADDHILMRGRLRTLLESTSLIEVVAEVSDGPSAIAEAQRLCPDLIIMDLALPCLNGLKTAVAIRQICPKAQVILLSMYDEPAYAKRALLHGAGAYLTKRTIESTLIPAIQRMFHGGQTTDATQPRLVKPRRWGMSPQRRSSLRWALPDPLDWKAPALSHWLGKLWKNWRSQTCRQGN